MNKAIEGNINEVTITKLLNQKNQYWENLPYDKIKTFAVHINSKKFGIINQEKIQPKADIYFAEGVIDNNLLINNEFYIDESLAESLKLIPIPYSGLSIKLLNSKYTISKISPNTFNKIFKNNILGAGASIYSTKEFEKNENVIRGWLVSINEFRDFFCHKLNIKNFELDDQKIMSLIKTFSNESIENIIISNIKTSDLIFKGIGNFEEPFTAHWLMENNSIIPNYYIPFSVTTGSGRSKGIYTIVLKPK